MDFVNGIVALKQAIDLVRSAIGVARDARDLMPESPNKNAISSALENADRAASVAEVQIAKELGYDFCKCTFPPQIMLKISGNEKPETYRCEKCGSERRIEAIKRKLTGIV